MLFGELASSNLLVCVASCYIAIDYLLNNLVVPLYDLAMSLL